MMEMAPLTDHGDGANHSRSPSEISSKKVQKPLRRATWLDSWLFEWITLVFSVSCFVTIAVILWVYDGKVRPELGHDLSLNAIISALATGCKSALVLVIGEAICQLKWLWFQSPRRRDGQQLIDIQRYDAASRGPLGSLMIVFHHRAQSLVSLGAIIVVLLLAFEPFMQQIISYPALATVDESSSALASAPQLRSFYPTTVHESELLNSFTRGFFTDGDFDVSPQCSSGNCTWDTFPSIGICSRCTDVSTVTPINCDLPSTEKAFSKTCSFSLPGDQTPYNFDVSFGFDHGMRKGIMNTTRRIIYQGINSTTWWYREDGSKPIYRPPNMTWAGVKNPLTGIAYVELELNQTGTGSGRMVPRNLYIKNATECILSTCLRDYDVSVTNGATSIKTQNIDFGTIYPEPKNGPLYQNGVKNKDTTLCWKPQPSNSTALGDIEDFAFCDDSMVQLPVDAGYFMPSTTKESIFAFRNTTSTDLDRWLPTSAIYPPGNSENDESRREYFQRVGFEKIMENIAASLTKFGLQNANHSINGDVQITKVFVSVRWPWIILPALLVLVGTIFFAATIAVSKKSDLPLWKSSALAAYYHGLERIDDNDDDNYDQHLPASVMEKEAETGYILLQRSEKNGRLVLRQQMN